MNWREWVYPKLCNVLPAASVFAGSAIREVPSVRPFCIYRLQTKVPSLRGDEKAVTTYDGLEVWVYDHPGSFNQIETLLRGIQTELEGQIAVSGAFCCSWEGDSGELSDDELKSIVKNSTYRLVGGAA